MTSASSASEEIESKKDKTPDYPPEIAAAVRSGEAALRRALHDLSVESLVDPDRYLMALDFDSGLCVVKGFGICSEPSLEHRKLVLNLCDSQLLLELAEVIQAIRRFQRPDRQGRHLALEEDHQPSLTREEWADLAPGSEFAFTID